MFRRVTTASALAVGITVLGGGFAGWAMNGNLNSTSDVSPRVEPSEPTSSEDVRGSTADPRPQQGEQPEIDESDPSLGPIFADIRATHRLANFSDAVTAASTIAVGQVTRIVSDYSNGWFRYRTLFVEIDETYMGAHQSVLEVRQLSEDVRTGRPIVVKGQLVPEVGDEVLLFLHSSKAAGSALTVVNEVAAFEIGEGRAVRETGRRQPFVRQVERMQLSEVREKVKAARGQ